jgi:hypothetical protein
MNPRLLPVLLRSTLVSLRALWRVTRQIFHEAMGTIFGLFAIYGAQAAWRQWKTQPVAWLIAFSIAYAIMMLVFSFFAFRRARRIGQLENPK